MILIYKNHCTFITKVHKASQHCSYGMSSSLSPYYLVMSVLKSMAKNLLSFNTISILKQFTSHQC